MVRTKKIGMAAANGLWQVFPAISLLLMSFVVVRLFSLAVWGELVYIIIASQFINTLINWGNKDFLLRSFAERPSHFYEAFSTFFAERSVVAVIALVAIFGLPFFWFSLPFTITLALVVLGRFLQQSMDVLVVIHRRFSFALKLEFILIGVQISALIFGRYIADIVHPMHLVYTVFAAGLLIKGVIYLLLFRSSFVYPSWTFHYLEKSFAFALQTWTGLLASRMDMVVAALVMSEATLGVYQIIMSFLWNIQAGANHFSGPFIHQFFRLSESVKRSSEQLLWKIGIAISAFGVLAMFVALTWLFQIQLSYELMIPCFIIAIQAYIYLPWLFRMMQKDDQRFIVYWNVVSVLLLSIILISAFYMLELNIGYILWLVAVHQSLATIMIFGIYRQRSSKWA
jgi:hypothetical protein